MKSRVRGMAAALGRAGVVVALGAGAVGLEGCGEVRSHLGASAVRGDEAPLFEGMGKHTRKVTTGVARAQRYFDQGLNWAFAFNHDEAIRSFEQAAKLDPQCAMAYWGIALCNGPHINNPAMDEERSRAAWEAARKAASLADRCTEVERALIEAVGRRYADPSSGTLPLTFEERAPLDKAYADAMGRVHARYKDDADVGALYAEALMDLRPWDLWGQDKSPRPEAPMVLAALERVLKIAPDHPLACHLYIHACESSPHPERADAAANRLRSLMPAAGHMVHMPAHIDIRMGRWGLAAEQNRQASRADDRYREVSPRQGFYRLYMAHNDHFLAYACMMLGRREEALSAARAMLSKVPKDWLEANAPIADGVAAIEIDVMQRFGMWDELLKAGEPPEILPITRAFWRFARAAAYNAKGMAAEAREEQAAFRRAVEAVPPEAMMAQNKGRDVLAIADLVLEGEMAYRAGDTDRAVEKLRGAAAKEDALRYMEPPDWLQPVRHSLGAVLLAAGRAGEAEAVYRKDLEYWPENGWSLFGLAESLKAQGKPDGAARARFEKAWKDADTRIGASCLCVGK
jgi:tetratricopeptide (TPR) repeat protein